MQLVLKVLIATIMIHVFICTPFMNQLIKQVNQISFKYQALASCLYWLIFTVNNVILKIGAWVGWKALPCTVPAIDMGAFLSLNLISSKQPSFRKISEDSLSNEYAEMISTNLEKAKIWLFSKGFPPSISKALQQWKYMTYNIH